MSVDAAVTPGSLRAPRGWQRLRGMAARIGTFSWVELVKLRHDRTELLTRMVQPALWLLIFVTTFNRLHVFDTGQVGYLAFLAPGIIAQSALFISIFYGIQIIWDRDAGILAKLMVTPAPASALVTAQSSPARGIFFASCRMRPNSPRSRMVVMDGCADKRVGRSWSR